MPKSFVISGRIPSKMLAIILRMNMQCGHTPANLFDALRTAAVAGIRLTMGEAFVKDIFSEPTAEDLSLIEACKRGYRAYTGKLPDDSEIKNLVTEVLSDLQEPKS